MRGGGDVLSLDSYETFNLEACYQHLRLASSCLPFWQRGEGRARHQRSKKRGGPRSPRHHGAAQARPRLRRRSPRVTRPAEALLPPTRAEAPAAAQLPHWWPRATRQDEAPLQPTRVSRSQHRHRGNDGRGPGNRGRPRGRRGRRAARQGPRQPGLRPGGAVENRAAAVTAPLLRGAGPGARSEPTAEGGAAAALAAPHLWRPPPGPARWGRRRCSGRRTSCRTAPPRRPRSWAAPAAPSRPPTRSAGPPPPGTTEPPPPPPAAAAGPAAPAARRRPPPPPCWDASGAQRGAGRGRAIATRRPWRRGLVPGRRPLGPGSRPRLLPASASRCFGCLRGRPGPCFPVRGAGGCPHTPFKESEAALPAAPNATPAVEGDTGLSPGGDPPVGSRPPPALHEPPPCPYPPLAQEVWGERGGVAPSFPLHRPSVLPSPGDKDIPQIKPLPLCLEPRFPRGVGHCLKEKSKTNEVKTTETARWTILWGNLLWKQKFQLHEASRWEEIKIVQVFGSRSVWSRSTSLSGREPFLLKTEDTMKGCT